MGENTLHHRISSWFALPMTKSEPYLTELSDIYYEITGQRVVCKGCNYTAMKTVLRRYYSNSNPINPTTMASSKYQFTKEAVNNKVTLIIHYPNSTKAVTADNITDRDAEHILNNEGLNKAYGHNIQLKKGADLPAVEEPEGDDPEELTAARSKYETLTGKKPGTRRLATLQEEISKAESNNSTSESAA